MSTTIRELLVAIGVDAGDADKQVERLDGALADLKEVMLGVVAVATAVTGAIVGIAVSAASAGDAVAKGAERTGIGVVSYQELAFAASQSAVELTMLEAALGKQALALDQAAQGSGAAVDAYARLGISTTQLAGLGADEAFLLTASALAAVTDETTRTGIATAIYGEQARQLMPLLMEGGEGMAALGQMAHDLGLVLSPGAVKAASLFGDTLDQVWAIVLGVRNAIGLQLAPVLTDLMVRFREWYAANAKLIQQKLEGYVDTLIAGIGALVRMAEAADLVVTRVFGGWGPVLAALAAAAAVVGVVFTALGALKVWGALAALKAVAVAAGASLGTLVAIALAAAAQLAILGLVIDDIVVYFRGGDSAIGRFIARFRESDGAVGAAARGFEKILGIMRRVGTVVQALGTIWWEVFSRTSLPVLKVLGAALLWLAEKGLGALGWWWDNVIGFVFDEMIAGLDRMIRLINYLQPLLAEFLSMLDSAASFAGGVLGIDLSAGGNGGEEALPPGMVAAPRAPAAKRATASAPLGGDFYGGASFAPTGAEAMGGRGAGGSSSTRSVTIQGNSYAFNNTGIDKDEALDLIRQSEAERARATSAAIEGGEV